MNLDMKLRSSLIILSIFFLLSGCGTKGNSVTPNEEPGTDTPVTPDAPVTPDDPKPPSPPSGPTKVVVNAHTLKDTNPPIDINSSGQQVNKATWDSFKYGGMNKFTGNYNFTYSAYSGGYQTLEQYTKNGYYMSSLAGSMYYERKSGSTFYQYINVSDGWLREETTFNLQNKYTDRIVQEIYVHMFEYSDYTYEDYDEMYHYYGSGFASAVKFQGGYLTYLFYILGMNVFEIKLAFETEIEIPKSYYYK